MVLGRCRLTSTIAEVAAHQKSSQDLSINPTNQERPFGLGGCWEWGCNGLLAVVVSGGASIK